MSFDRFSQNKNSFHENPGTNKNEESKAHLNGSSNFQKKYNWQKNVVSPTPNAYNLTSQFKPLHLNSHRDYTNVLDIGRRYRLITSETKLWAHFSRSMDAIIKPSPTTRSFQYLLDIIQANSRTRNSYDISLLDRCLKSLPDKHKQLFQTRVFPEMARLLLKTSTLFPDSKGLELLTQGHSETRSLTREQCACLLFHMFMCTTLKQFSNLLPMRHDFSELYSSTRQHDKDAVKYQKILCLLYYFKQITTSSLNMKENVTFSRVNLNEQFHGECDLSAWTNLNDPLQELYFESKGNIEDSQNTVEVDFANKYLGGGVLGSGSVQEEIQFITRPEQLVGLLLCESMTDKEAILIRGAKIYSGYKGYASSFIFDEKTPNNDRQYCEREVVAIDAKDYSSTYPYTQFRKEEILRELNKAYVGFFGDGESTRRKMISTGNWGCGCFKGDTQLKFLLQWMAASRAGRQMVFHTFGMKDVSGFQQIVKTYERESVGSLLKDILKCCDFMSSGRINDKLFDLLISANRHKRFGSL